MKSRIWRIAGMMLLATLLPAWGQAGVDEDFMAARKAQQSGNLPTLERYAVQLAAEPLGIYVRYWALSRGLARELVDESTLQQFLQEQKTTLPAEKLRGEWLTKLADDEDWPRFLQEYPLLLQPSLSLRCHWLHARTLQRDNTAIRDTRELWFSGKDLPDSCTPLFETLIENGMLDDDDIRERQRLAFELGETAVARYLYRYLPQNSRAWAQKIDPLLANPGQFLSAANPGNADERALIVLALYRIGRTDLDDAWARWQHLRPAFEGDEQAGMFRMLALLAVRQQRPEALDWFALARGARFSENHKETWARAAIRAQNWRSLLSIMDGMKKETREQRAWLYWRARAAKARGMLSSAQKILAQLSRDDDYYGLLAREELGPTMSVRTRVYHVNERDLQQAGAIAGIQRAQQLYKLGLRYEAVREWDWILRTLDDRMLLAAAEIANQLGWYDRAIKAAESTRTMHDYALRYLSPYREVTRGYADELALDEAWVYGLIRQESRFVSEARSGVGAGGLMQLMPKTAQWVANRMGIKYHADMVNEVGSNVRLGTYYLNHVLQILNNQPVLATAAYNAGPNRARAWQGATAMDATIYIETIPYQETRDYVKKVMSNAHHYALAFGQSTQPLRVRLGVIPGRAATVAVDLSSEAAKGPDLVPAQ